MKNVLILFLLAAALALPLGAQESNQDSQLNDAVGKVLDVTKNFHPGMTRADLQKTFTYEGGLISAQYDRMVYRKCPCVKIDVQFKLVVPGGRNANDVAVKISKPYLEYEVID